MTVTVTDLLADVPEVSTRLDDQDPSVPEIIRGTGHLPEMRVDPIGLFTRVREECGDVGRFRLADKDVVMVTGAEANEEFFRAPEEVLDQAAAYPFMTPIFGKGVVFDASPEERQQMLKNQALRGDMMRGHAQTIEAEIRRMVADWGDEGEIDLLDFFAELTIYTTSSCLIGKPFREELDASFAHHYHELEHGTDAIAYVDPYADIENFRMRDAARLKLVELVQQIIDKRVLRGKVAREDRDLLDVLISLKNEDGTDQFTADLVTGIFISMMFAGHHTSSGTASWAMIELMRHPEVMESVVSELDELYADGSEVSFQALREIPMLESVLKETLRLHPPLIILMRLVQQDFELLGHTIPAGTLIAASPRVSNRIEEDFPARGGVRPEPLHRPAPGRPAEQVDLDPVRRRQAPLRRQRVRDDADEGDLLGHPARLRVHPGSAGRQLQGRLHQDGDPARAAVSRHVQAALVMTHLRGRRR